MCINLNVNYSLQGLVLAMYFSETAQRLHVFISSCGDVERQVEADVIFGNDGAHSVVRKDIMKRTRCPILK